ncbi:MAG: DNA adenine methylase [Spirochaetia bacterium]|nr:DNA adenine methylase [Spirochaetia bacterium]
MGKDKMVAPVVKWVGGKRQLLPIIMSYLPSDYTTYYEPFVGGGAVLFEVQPKKAIINDVNEELINMYNVVKDNVSELLIDLQKHKNSSSYFYEVRSWDRDPVYYDKLSNIEKASRLIYLNKTCYNGLFRVNLMGQFNSPFGRYKNPAIIDESRLIAVSNYLRKSEIKFTNLDFELSLKGIRKDSFVYFDPPYDPISNSSNFTGYSKGGFDKNEQIRLKKLCDKLNARSVKFLLSNSNTPFISELYRDYNPIPITAKRSVNSNGAKRGFVNEILVKNYD